MIDAKTRADLAWDQLLEYLEARCHTGRGAEAVRQLEPFEDIAQAQEHIQQVSEARHLSAQSSPLSFGGIEDVVEFVARAQKGGALAGDELRAVAHTASGCARLVRHIEGHKGDVPRLAEVVSPVADLAPLFEPILRSFAPDGSLADDASPDLGRLRRAATRLGAELEDRARKLASDPKIQPHLQEHYVTQRDDRYVLPVKLGAQGRVNGIVHGTSQSGQTVFIEPAVIVDLNNRLTLAVCEVADEERRILFELSGRVADRADDLVAAVDIATWLDRIAAVARMADDLEASEPVFDDSGALALKAARHPLMLLSGKGCVPNDIALEPGQIMIVSGPNAGGKTVSLKTAGLASLMARSGMHIAAKEGSRLPWYGNILTDIGDSQSLDSDLSTFSGHLLKLNRFLAEADGHTLLLIDEVAVGTDPDQGAALAQAVLETLAERGVPAMVTTHYEPLKALGATDPRFCNASVGYDMDAMEPTFRLHAGVPGSSGALEVARRLGLRGDVAERAALLLGEGRAKIDELLRSLADSREKLEAERDELRELSEKARRATERAEQRERRALESAHSEAVSALREARIALDRAKTSVRKRSTASELKSDAAAIDRAGRAISDHAPAAAQVEGRPVDPATLAPGQAVIVPSLGGRGRGVVVDRPDRGRVTVQVGVLKTTVAVSDLLIDPAGKGGKKSKKPGTKKAAAPVPRGAGGSVATVRADDEGRAGVRSADATLDLRGDRVDDAIAMLDRFVDQNVLASREVVWVIHGHGTGALRRAVREHLGAHPSVSKLRPGERAEGGDGVTVAWLAS